MAYEPKPGDSALFPNKSDNLNAPKYKGYVILHRDCKAGERLDLAMWDKKGGSFLGGKVSDPRRSRDDDSIPF